MRHGRKHLAGPGNNNVAAKHEIGAAGGDADRMDVARLIGKPNMAVYSAALLREARHIEDTHSPALEMGCHAQDSTDRYDPGAADAGDDDVVSLLDCRQLWLR